MEDPKRTVLVVEDEASLRDALERKLSGSGYNVLLASNGEEGLEMALTHHPALILLDIVMPKMDGLSMLSTLRKDAWGKSADVVILTNLNDAERVEEATAQDCFDFYVKSDWAIGDIISKVDEKLNT